MDAHDSASAKSIRLTYYSPMEDLDNDMLTEIFVRIPCTKAVCLQIRVQALAGNSRIWNVFSFETGAWEHIKYGSSEDSVMLISMLLSQYGAIGCDTSTMKLCHLKGEARNTPMRDTMQRDLNRRIDSRCNGICCRIFREVSRSCYDKYGKEYCFTVTDATDYKFIVSLDEDEVDDVKIDPKTRRLHDLVRNCIGNRKVSRLKPFAVHPSDRDVVFLNTPKLVFSFSLKTEELKLVGKGPVDNLDPRMVFPIELPWWPTPIPCFPTSFGGEGII
ncbi:hypothetical protein COLO4_30693 [Corchorus olitorius]|uniref:Uncharacterized protein n=1 Tax=Corchorus olitorius TaxID=93759 RepID=A0A1R3H7F1_9ROSI|nr:hypothetical protein COLO4_30693 [Corchorus olitorius]